MSKFRHCVTILLISILVGRPCHAAKLNVFVNSFSLCAAENRDELKTALQTMLMSRLKSRDIETVENKTDATVQVTGTYIEIGTVFSLDAVLRTNSGTYLDRTFVQGDTRNELIPAVTELAKHLHQAIIQAKPLLTVQATTAKATTEEEITAIKVNTDFSQKPALVSLPVAVQLPEELSTSQKIPGTLNGIAVGRPVSFESVELFITGERYLRYYLYGKELQLLAEIVLAADEKIIGIDSADLDRDGVPEIYVTMLKGEQPASQVYIPEGRSLKKIGEQIPYLLRGIALEGQEQKIFAQQIDANGKFSGGIYELLKTGNSFTVKNSLQLPLFGTLYNFNTFRDAQGKSHFVIYHPDGFLLVYSAEKKQLWKSRDKFGGSETRVCKSTNLDPAMPTQQACNFSPPQRLLVTSGGNIFISRNTGAISSRAGRTYSKNSIIQLSWDGKSLQPKWRSKPHQSYLADFAFTASGKDLFLLEVEPLGEQAGERDSRIVLQKM